MYSLIAGADRAFRENLLAALGIRDETAGFPDDENARRQVPGLQIAFPAAVIGAGSDEAEIERRGAEPAQIRCPRHDRGKRHFETRMARLAEMGNAATDERLAHVAARRHSQATIVEIGTLAFLGDIHRFCRRIIDEAGDNLAFALQAD